MVNVAISVGDDLDHGLWREVVVELVEVPEARWCPVIVICHNVFGGLFGTRVGPLLLCSIELTWWVFTMVVVA